MRRVFKKFEDLKKLQDLRELQIFKKLIDNSGQAIIEYILILVVVVGVILGALYQLNSAFKFWADNYFGEYLACLIETGELPALGGNNAQGECSQHFKEFSLANGKPLIGKPIGENGSEDGSDSKDKDAAGANGGAQAVGSTNGNSSGSLIAQRLGSSGSFGSGSSRFRMGKSGAGADGADGGSASDTGSAAITDLGGGQNRNAVVMMPLRQSAGIRGGRRVETEDEKLKDKTKVKKPESKKTAQRTQETIRVERRVASNVETADIDGFSFGNMFRYFLMAIIIIAVVIFVGGQILQVTKSME